MEPPVQCRVANSRSICHIILSGFLLKEPPYSLRISFRPHRVSVSPLLNANSCTVPGARVRSLTAIKSCLGLHRTLHSIFFFLPLQASPILIWMRVFSALCLKIDMINKPNCIMGFYAGFHFFWRPYPRDHPLWLSVGFWRMKTASVLITGPGGHQGRRIDG